MIKCGVHASALVFEVVFQVKSHENCGYARRVTSLGKQKLSAGLVLAGCLCVLAIATLLTPDLGGFGTHQQVRWPTIAGVTLRLPPCAMRSLTGIPCASCGMTTAFACVVHGQIGQAFRAQPFGLVLFALVVGAAVDSAVFLVFNRSIRQARLPWKKIILALVALWAAAWAWKIWVTLAPKG